MYILAGSAISNLRCKGLEACSWLFRFNERSCNLFVYFGAFTTLTWHATPGHCQLEWRRKKDGWTYTLLYSWWTRRLATISRSKKFWILIVILPFHSMYRVLLSPKVQTPTPFCFCLMRLMYKFKIFDLKLTMNLFNFRSTLSWFCIIRYSTKMMKTRATCGNYV